MQIPMFAPVSLWKPPSLSELPDWNRATRVGYDVETKDPNLSKKGMGPGTFDGTGHVAGFGFALEGGKSFYLPVRHLGGDNLPLDNVLRYMRDQAKNFKGELVGANLAYDLDWSAVDGIKFNAVSFVRDVQIADPLINELSPSMALEAICERRLGEGRGKNEDLLRAAGLEYGLIGKNRDEVKKRLHELPARYVGEYCERDCAAPLEVLRVQEKLIDQLGIWDIWNLESKVLPVLLKMRQRGVLIDQDKLRYVQKWVREQAAVAINEIKRLTGVSLAFHNLWTKEALVPVFESLGITLRKMKVNKKGKPEYQIDKALFSAHIKEQPAIKALAWARKVSKLDQFAEATWKALCPDGRIHCSFNQMALENDDGDQKGCRYGRMSCTNPNLQQQPSRDEFAKMWRSIYVAEKGTRWVCLDYSQQEPRWTTHFAASTYIQPGTAMARELGFSGYLTKAAEAAQAYWDDPLLDNHDFMAALTGLPRKHAKNVYLGLCYGEGAAKLCHDLGLPTVWAVRYKGIKELEKFDHLEDAIQAADRYVGEASWFETAGEEGQKILDTFDARAPFIRQLAKVASYFAKTRGFIRTIAGRILHFPRRKDGSYDWCHKALNRIIQGSSADQNKMAIVEIDREEPDFFLQLTVHDELDGSVADPAQRRRVAAIQRLCAGKTKVPFRVDEEDGDNWGELAAAA